MLRWAKNQAIMAVDWSWDHCITMKDIIVLYAVNPLRNRMTLWFVRNAVCLIIVPVGKTRDIVISTIFTGRMTNGAAIVHQLFKASKRMSTTTRILIELVRVAKRKILNLLNFANIAVRRLLGITIGTLMPHKTRLIVNISLSAMQINLLVMWIRTKKLTE